MPSYDQIMHVVKSPEFWMSVAFVCVIILAFRPLRRFLRKWGAKRADDIMSKIETAKEMNQKAEELLQKYETQTRN
ncbi:MAG: hypothetical protein LBU87_06500, partial [Lactobacillales bacterium]|nr:hypothetical protein [Lactobacillales bacterium]